MGTDINKLHVEFLYQIVKNNGVECEDFPDVFFPEGTEASKRYDTTTAKIICQDCPLKNECLEFALKSEQEYGIWGGLTPEERRKLTKGRRNPTYPSSFAN